MPIICMNIVRTKSTVMLAQPGTATEEVVRVVSTASKSRRFRNPVIWTKDDTLAEGNQALLEGDAGGIKDVTKEGSRVLMIGERLPEDIVTRGQTNIPVIFGEDLTCTLIWIATGDGTPRSQPL